MGEFGYCKAALGIDKYEYIYILPTGLLEPGTKGKAVNTRKSRKKLKRVIAIRHGEYSDRTMKLNEEGRQQMQELAERIKQFVLKRQVVEVFSSSEIRAVQSAMMMGSLFGVSPIVCRKLNSDEYDDGGEKMSELLTARNGSDVIIAVTHFKSPSGIINAFATRYFQKEVECMESVKGNGCMLDLKTGNISLDLFE